MRHLLRLLTALALTTMTALTASAQNTTPPSGDDPYLWLEDVQGERAMAWVRERNAASRQRLEAWPHFQPSRDRIREILDSRDRIPAVSRRGGFLYNLWQDAANPRGLWRRTTLAEYRQPQPAWDVLLDLDALGKAEGESWTWGGAECLGPAYTRCLVSLSRGGADATVVREFDLATRRFVDGGFTLPEAKSSVTWIDRDTVFVGTDFGPGSLTDSGYPRVIKRWTRGQPLAQAVTVFEGEKTDVAAAVSVDHTPGHRRTVFARYLDFYNSKVSLLQGKKLVPLAKPSDANLSFWYGQALLELRSDWAHAGRTWPRGSLLASDARAFIAGQPRFTAIFTPTPTRSLAGFSVTRTTVLLNVLDNVASRLQDARLDGRKGWATRDVAAPFPGTLSVASWHDALIKDDPLAEAYTLSYTDFLTPDTLYLGRTGSDAREALKSRPNFFDAGGMRVEQRFAASKDGTRVPYFVVWPKGATADGRNPTLLYGYGGFEQSMQPWYSGAFGSTWYGRGGVLVVANIRGGGEYGPAWHQAAVKADKQKSFDDFAAVAQDLVAQKITSAQQLGIMGGSNGGLLVSAVMLQRPELLGAVVSQVPLLDMKRYHRLLAGASWMAEYGDPDKPEEWAWLSAYSPYQNVRRESKLPPVLFITSTRDDRVHPGHARKMAARMIEQGHEVVYYENIEGGHGGAADNAQRADMTTLEFAFLWQQLDRRSALPATPSPATRP
jgi:prolyl oligopeptidase